MTSSTNSTPRMVRDLFVEHLKKSRRAYDEANRISKEFVDSGTFENENVAYIAAGESREFKLAVGEQQFNERLANMYGQAAILNAVEALIVEQRQTNDLLRKIYQEGTVR